MSRRTTPVNLSGTDRDLSSIQGKTGKRRRPSFTTPKTPYRYSSTFILRKKCRIRQFMMNPLTLRIKPILLLLVILTANSLFTFGRGKKSSWNNLPLKLFRGSAIQLPKQWITRDGRGFHLKILKMKRNINRFLKAIYFIFL